VRARDTGEFGRQRHSVHDCTDTRRPPLRCITPRGVTPLAVCSGGIPRSSSLW